VPEPLNILSLPLDAGLWIPLLVTHKMAQENDGWAAMPSNNQQPIEATLLTYHLKYFEHCVPELVCGSQIRATSRGV